MSGYEHRETTSRIVAAARKNRISRREFMATAPSAGLGVMAAGALWTQHAAAEEPRRGGTYRLGLHDGNTSDTMDPGKFQSIGEIQLAHTHRSYLTEIRSDNTLGPDMADAWTATPDAKTWTFELNSQARFHDGRAFTARDAVASLNHHRGSRSTSAATPLLDSVTDVSADGDHVLVIELDQGFVDLPWILTDYHLTMLPAKADDTIEWETGTGAGPYRIVSHEPGVGTELERHGGWHRKGAWFDKVEITILNDPNARQASLMAGDVDAISSVDLKTMALLGRHPEIDIENVPGGSAITLPMFCDHPPFDDVHVRRALKLAVDREELVEKILFGTGTVGNDFHVSSNMPYWPDLPQRAYDPDEARHHLRKAGLEGLRVQLSAADSVFPGAVDLVVLYSEQAKKANIDITPVREPNDRYWSDVWLKKPFVFVKWGARPTPDNVFTLAYKADAPWNEAHWKNERFNELLLLAKAEFDEVLRAEMYREMCQIARDDGGTILPLFLNFVYARNKRVRRGANVSASWECDGARSAHRWWFA